MTRAILFTLLLAACTKPAPASNEKEVEATALKTASLLLDLTDDLIAAKEELAHCQGMLRAHTRPVHSGHANPEKAVPPVSQEGSTP